MSDLTPERWLEGVKRRAQAGRDGWVRVPRSDWQGVIEAFEMGEGLLDASRERVAALEAERDEKVGDTKFVSSYHAPTWEKVQAQQDRLSKLERKYATVKGDLRVSNERVRAAEAEVEKLRGERDTLQRKLDAANRAIPPAIREVLSRAATDIPEKE